MLTAARKVGIERVVLASSCNIYGRATSTDIDETTDPDPINPYAETKAAAEDLLREATADSGMTGTALRLSTVYGDAPGIRFNLVVNAFVFRALTGRPLTVYGDGSNWRPFIHVADAARAYRDAALRPDDWSEPIYNVGANDENYRISEIAEIVSEEVGAADVTYLEDEHPGPSYHVNFDRVTETGFEPEYVAPRGRSRPRREVHRVSDAPTIAITGAAGYIGSCIITQLREAHPDWKIRAFDDFSVGDLRGIEDVEIDRLDVRDRDRLEDALDGADIVFHLAAVSGVDDCATNPDLAFEVNVHGTENVAWFCRKTGTGLVFPYSMGVIGDPEEFPITVDHPRTRSTGTAGRNSSRSEASRPWPRASSRLTSS